MMRAIAALAGGLLLWMLAAGQVAAQSAAPPPAQTGVRMMLVGSGFFPQGKLAMYRQLAAANGVELEYVAAPLPADQLPALLKRMAQADLVLAELPPVQLYRDEQLPRQLAGLPRVLMVERDAQRSRGLAPATEQTLAQYARHGGRQNLAALFGYLRHWRATGQPPADAPAPQVIPKTGIYHPDYEGLAFADLPAYLHWLGARVRPGQPVVGIAMFASAIGSESTAHIDALIRGVEQRGGIAIPFFRDTDAGAPVEALLMRDGQPYADVVVNFEILYRGSIGGDYARLGVPVLQAITYWDGPETSWQQDRQGISPGSTSFYLAIPEQAGFIDPLIVAAGKSRTPPRPIAAQMDSLLNKALAYASLRQKANADKRLSIVFYNYPPGEKNLGASGLNLPDSLQATLAALAQAGYDAGTLPPQALLPRLQELLSAYYRDGRLAELEQQGLLAWLPMDDYRQWLRQLPDTVQQSLVQHWGEPERSAFALRRDGRMYFAIPRLQLGNTVLLPQPMRGRVSGATANASYHDTGVPVDHFYLATYLYLRTVWKSDALIHFGTHGTQEWTYGKERGLSVHDNPMLLVGDVPVVYPFIVDDVGEALQAKRRGRAVIISHQTPSFGRAGLHGDPLRLHQLIEEYNALDRGAVRDRARAQILALSAGAIGGDLGWSRERIEADFDAYLTALHGYLDELADAAQPQGLHTFGTPAAEDRRLDTVRLMLGKRLDAALGIAAPHADGFDYRLADQEPGRAWLQRHLLAGASDADDDLPAAQKDLLASARKLHAALDARSEMQALLAALAGRYTTPGLGGDPLRTPESLPTGRNLYGFDPMRVPSRAAWEAGQEALLKLLDAYRQQHGQYPEKLAFSLWGVETMRHNGILEAQVLAALGVRPVWDDGGRISGVELIPAGALGRPRIDVVLSATGLYRDQFPVVMQRMNEALALVEAETGGNAIARHSAAVRARLLAQGMDADSADRYARTRIFASAQGNYGSGLGGKVLRTDAWEDDGELADSYLQQMQYGYGPDPAHWGEIPAQGNAYAEHLRGTQAAVLSRSSNLYGMLTTDDPFSYLGGLSLAVRHLDGRAPEVYISNLRDPGSSRVETAAAFLAKELQTRQFHPGWIKEMQREGYAGTLEVVSSMDNFWGWQAVDPGTVRDQQWQEFHDVYVKDRHKLGLRRWFRDNNPQALAQIVERMLEAHRKGYWHAEPETLRSLAQTWNQLESEMDILPTSSQVRQHAALLSTGFGLDPPARRTPSRTPPRGAPPASTSPPAPATASQAAVAAKAAKPATPVVKGLRLSTRPPAPPASPWWWLGLLPALAAFVLGALVQRRAITRLLPLSSAEIP